jgi:DNA-binding NarL/FixJ family response regulator
MKQPNVRSLTHLHLTGTNPFADGGFEDIIAQLLFISEKTVENHRSNIMKKLSLPAEKNALLVWALKNLPG